MDVERTWFNGDDYGNWFGPRGIASCHADERHVFKRFKERPKVWYSARIALPTFIPSARLRSSPHDSATARLSCSPAPPSPPTRRDHLHAALEKVRQSCATETMKPKYGEGAPVTLDMVNGLTLNGLSYMLASDQDHMERWVKGNDPAALRDGDAPAPRLPARVTRPSAADRLPHRLAHSPIRLLSTSPEPFFAGCVLARQNREEIRSCECVLHRQNQIERGLRREIKFQDSCGISYSILCDEAEIRENRPSGRIHPMDSLANRRKTLLIRTTSVSSMAEGVCGYTEKDLAQTRLKTSVSRIRVFRSSTN